MDDEDERQFLSAGDAARRIVALDKPQGRREIGRLHATPSQRAQDGGPGSGLSCAGRWVCRGWIEASGMTLRQLRRLEVFAVGVLAGAPTGKTTARVTRRVPVVEDHLVAAIAGRDGIAARDGYASYPQLTEPDKPMLIEFDARTNLTPSFPGRDRAARRALDRSAEEARRPERDLRGQLARPRDEEKALKELTLAPLFALFDRMFGRMPFWSMVRAAAGPTFACLYVLARERAVFWRKFLLVQLSTPFGAAAVLFVWWATDTGAHDVGGPIDVIILLALAAAAAVGAAILVPTAEQFDVSWRTGR